MRKNGKQRQGKVTNRGGQGRVGKGERERDSCQLVTFLSAKELMSFAWRLWLADKLQQDRLQNEQTWKAETDR